MGLIRGPGEPELLEVEMVHFNSDKISVRQLCDKFGPVLKGMTGKRTRRPADIARRLNTAGHRTASGAMWTPRLVYFLQKLVRGDRAPLPVQARLKPKLRPTSPVMESRPLTQETMAAKLQSLGRVTIRKV